jgi:hypothetical protein
MSYIITTIGRGLQAVEVHYDIWEDTPECLQVEVQEVYLYCRPAGGEQCRVDVSGVLTEPVYESLESDCRAHEINERARLAYGDDSGAKKRALAHYTRQAEIAGAV